MGSEVRMTEDRQGVNKKTLIMHATAAIIELLMSLPRDARLHFKTSYLLAKPKQI
jgi:hypothetical protein